MSEKDKAAPVTPAVTPAKAGTAPGFASSTQGKTTKESNGITVFTR